MTTPRKPTTAAKDIEQVAKAIEPNTQKFESTYKRSLTKMSSLPAELLEIKQRSKQVVRLLSEEIKTERAAVQSNPLIKRNIQALHRDNDFLDALIAKVGSSQARNQVQRFNQSFAVPRDEIKQYINNGEDLLAEVSKFITDLKARIQEIAEFIIERKPKQLIENEIEKISAVRNRIDDKVDTFEANAKNVHPKLSPLENDVRIVLGAEAVAMPEVPRPE